MNNIKKKKFVIDFEETIIKTNWKIFYIDVE